MPPRQLPLFRQLKRRCSPRSSAPPSPASAPLSSRGYTLLELLLVLLIAGVLLSLAGGWGDLAERERRFQAVLELRRALNYARSQAVFLQDEVTLCALTEDRRCHRDWRGRDYAIFQDRNGNRRLDPGEALRINHWPASRGELRWRAAFARPHLSFTPAGAAAQNGSFWHCPPNASAAADNTAPATRIVINRAGRNYVDENNRRGCE